MHSHHLVKIGAPRDISGAAKPALLQRNDDDFIESTLDDLRTHAGRQTLQGLLARATDDSGTLKLFQPIQRQFHLALIEAWCDLPGTPRIAADKVEAAGMVLRRIGAGGRHEGWMRSKGHVRGWLPLSRIGGAAADPVAAQRLVLGLTGVSDIDREFTGFALANADSRLDEDVVPLYLAPPDVCAEATKTLFYGIVPTISSELSESEPVFAGAAEATFGPHTKLFRDHLVEALRGDAMAFAFAGETVRSGWFDAMEAVGDEVPEHMTKAQSDALKNPRSDESRSMRRFVLLLRQLSSEFNAFDSAPGSADLKRLLHDIQLPLKLRGNELRRHVPADEFLARAHTILLEQVSTGADLEMPESWPALLPADAAKLAAAMHKAMRARFDATIGKAGRFDEPGARYVLRAFVRLKPEGPCPSRIVWSDYSDPFVIAAWYEGAGAPPVQIPLPDPSNRKLLKSLKPNVAFIVPPAMQNLLSGSAKDLMEGKGSTGQLGITWICSFSLPIITICAFIVLNIFLSLLNIVFGWMFFVKICIPFPKFGDKPPGG